MKRVPLPTLPGQKEPTRRSFLKRGLLGGALLGLGGAGLLFKRQTKRVPLPPKPLSVLSEDEYSVMHAVASRIVAPGAGAPSFEQVNVAANVDEILRHTDPGAQKEVKQLLGLFENALAGFVFGRRINAFSAMTPEDQDQVLREWQTSRLVIRRTGFTALRTLALAGYYSSDQTWSFIGYEGPPKDFFDPNAPVWKGGGAPRPEVAAATTPPPPPQPSAPAPATHHRRRRR